MKQVKQLSKSPIPSKEGTSLKQYFYSKIKDMIRYIKIWRLVSCIYKRCGRKSTYLTRKQVLEEIMKGNSPGIAKEWIIEKYAKRHLTSIEKILPLYKSALEKKFIEEETYAGNLKVVRVTTKGGDIIGYVPLVNNLLKEYSSWWMWIVFPVMSFIVGIYKDQILNFLHFVK